MENGARIGLAWPSFLTCIVVLVVLLGADSWWGGMGSGSVLGGPSMGNGHPAPATTIEVHVELSPAIVHGPLVRCIDFWFYGDCDVAPVPCTAEIAFDNPLTPGIGSAIIAVGAACPVDIEDVSVVTAIDPLHTLRSVGELDHESETLIVRFEGNPEEGGHWLVGGNLDAWNPDTSPANGGTINILDFGVFVGQYLRSYSEGSTACGASGPHADINGDGVVDGLDFAFIVDNFLAQSESLECDPLGTDPNPLAEISVAELIELGLEQLVVADLNRDGWLNVDDMILFRRKRLR